VTASSTQKTKKPAKSKAVTKAKPLTDLNTLPAGTSSARPKRSSFGWDLTGVFLLALGLVLLLGGLGMTHGIILDAILHQLAVWFGLGRLIIPVGLLLAAWLLLSRQRQQEVNFQLVRVVLVELGLIGVLGALSAFAREQVLTVEGARA